MKKIQLILHKHVFLLILILGFLWLFGASFMTYSRHQIRSYPVIGRLLRINSTPIISILVRSVSPDSGSSMMFVTERLLSRLDKRSPSSDVLLYIRTLFLAILLELQSERIGLCAC